MRKYLVLLFLLVSFVGYAAQSISNRHQVTRNIARGGQPTESGWQQLYNEGYREVVKLNTGKDTEAEKLGMIVHYCPIDTIDQTIGKPKQATIDKAIIYIARAQANHRKIYVHCTHGQDRTGLVIGTYRILFMRWSKNSAYHEMKALGFHPMLRGLYWYWEEDVPNQ